MFTLNFNYRKVKNCNIYGPPLSFVKIDEQLYYCIILNILKSRKLNCNN